MTVHHFDVESTANPRAKAWALLSKRSERERTNMFLIEGSRETERATRHLEILETLWCPELAENPPHPTDNITVVSERVFHKLSRRQNPDGIAAIARTPDMSLASFDPGGEPLVLVADAIEKPGNIGAMLRTCDALGAAFIGSSLATDIVNPNVVRAAQGSLLATPIATASIEESIGWCTTHTRVIVAHPGHAESLWEQDLQGATSIVIGSEHAGVNRRWLDVGDPVLVPMSGDADSLNASVTAGIFLAEAARQRSG